MKNQECLKQNEYEENYLKKCNYQFKMIHDILNVNNMFCLKYSILSHVMLL